MASQQQQAAASASAATTAEAGTPEPTAAAAAAAAEELHMDEDQKRAYSAAWDGLREPATEFLAPPIPAVVSLERFPASAATTSRPAEAAAAAAVSSAAAAAAPSAVPPRQQQQQQQQQDQQSSMSSSSVDGGGVSEPTGDSADSVISEMMDDADTTIPPQSLRQQQVLAAALLAQAAQLPLEETMPITIITHSRGHHELYRALEQLEGLEKEEATLLERADLTRRLTEIVTGDRYDSSEQALRELEGIGRAVPRRVCQHPFRKNDIVWVCRTCQADETCVLCHACFSQSHHEGHDVAFYHAQAGGCCDCGDPDGTLVPLLALLVCSLC